MSSIDSSSGPAPAPARERPGPRPRCRNGFNTLRMIDASLDSFVRKLDDRELRALIRHCLDVGTGARWFRTGYRESTPEEKARAAAAYYSAYNEQRDRREARARDRKRRVV